jgi:hypothetical protein
MNAFHALHFNAPHSPVANLAAGLDRLEAFLDAEASTLDAVLSREDKSAALADLDALVSLHLAFDAAPQIITARLEEARRLVRRLREAVVRIIYDLVEDRDPTTRCAGARLDDIGSMLTYVLNAD